MAHARRTSYWQLKTIHDAITADTELIARSDDAGANWIVMPLPAGACVKILCVAPSAPSTLYIASLNDIRVS